MNFTNEQKDIFEFVKSGSGNGIIDAVAGAGKTTTIMECARFAENVSNKILFCAFNKSISKEINEKLNKRGLINVTVKTIHALGYQMLSANKTLDVRINVQDKKYDKLLKSEEVQRILKPYYHNILTVNGLRPELAESDKNEAYAINKLVFQINSRVLDINQKFRATLTKPILEDFKVLVTHFGIFNDLDIKKKQFEYEMQAYFQITLELLKIGNELARKTLTMDYTDMIYLPYEWALEAPIKYDLLFIDECQDLSRSQLAVVAKYGRETSRVLAVGDPRQSIYGFTGADIQSFDHVGRLFKAKQYPLTSCFRCPTKVIELAKTIRSDITGVKKEPGVVCDITTDKIFELAKPGDLIISRLRSPLLILVFTFIDKNIRVQIHEDEVKEVINELKIIFKHEELQIRIDHYANKFEGLKSIVLKRAQWVIQKEAERIIDPIERKLHIEDETDYLNQRLEFLNRKYEQWKLNCPTMNHIIEKIREFVSATTESIKLSTIHRAKGLENERVFILDYDELPMHHAEQKEWESVQEMNLKYVAVTRAMQELYLVREAKVEVLKEKSLFDVLPFDA